MKVKDAPLAQVLKSIEWQGWVKIYSNLPKDTKVTMYVDRVPLSEAMETLAANVVLPPSDNNTPDRANRPDRPNRPDGGGLGGGAGGPGGGAGGGQGGPPPL